MKLRDLMWNTVIFRYCVDYLVMCQENGTVFTEEELRRVKNSLPMTTVAPSAKQDLTEEDENLLDLFIINNNLLYHKLMDNYVPGMSPFYTLYDSPRNRSKSYPPQSYVEMILTHSRLLTLDETDEKITVSLEFLMKWYDRRLRWNPEEYGGIKHIYIKRPALWTPELYFVDSQNAEDTRADHIQNVKVNQLLKNSKTRLHQSTSDEESERSQCRYESTLKVHYDGLATFFTNCAPTTNCPVLITKFPFDNQTCEIQITISGFSIDEVQILSQVAPEMQVAGSEDSGWKITKIDVINDLIIYENDTEKSYESDAFIIRLKREPMFYISIIVIPSFILTTLSIFGIFAVEGHDHSTMDGKMGIGLTSLMSMIFLIGIVANSMPKSGSIPRLAVYVLVNAGILGVSVILLVTIPVAKRFYQDRDKFRTRKEHRLVVIFHLIVRNVLRSYVLMTILEICNFVAFGVFFC